MSNNELIDSWCILEQKQFLNNKQIEIIHRTVAHCSMWDKGHIFCLLSAPLWLNVQDESLADLGCSSGGHAQKYFLYLQK